MQARKSNKFFIKLNQSNRRIMSQKANSDYERHKRIKRLERADGLDMTPREAKFWVVLIAVSVLAVLFFLVTNYE